MSTETKSEYLDEIEEREIIKFNGNPIMKRAVKKVLLNVIYNQGILEAGEDPDFLRNFALSKVSQREFSNEELGADLRALWEGCNLLENGFRTLEKIQKPVVAGNKKKVNPAT